LGEHTGFFHNVATDGCTALNGEELNKFDAIFFATSGELPISDKNKTDLINSIKSGKGFIGVHNATDTFQKFPAYGEMIGGYFNGHPWTQNVFVKVEDRTHPSTKHLPPFFKVKEEIYTYRDWSCNKTHTLVSLDNKSVDISKGNREDHDYALCWCHEYGHGRVFYAGFGHFTELWNES
jgi:hypothetical protein